MSSEHCRVLLLDLTFACALISAIGPATRAQAITDEHVFGLRGAHLSYYLEGGFDTPVSPCDVMVADLNNDGVDDLALGGNNYLHVLIANGDATFASSNRYSMPNPCSDYNDLWDIADFNNDGNLDAVVGFDTFSVRFGNGDGTFSEVVDDYRSRIGFPKTLAVGDYNGDGNADLAVWGEPAQYVFVIPGNGDGTFGEEIEAHFEWPYDLETLVPEDLDGDGVTDLAALAYSGRSLYILLSNGDGTLRKEAEYEIGNRIKSLAIGDFNRDAIADIAVTADSTDIDAVYVFIGNGDGTFALSPTTYSVERYVHAVSAADLNGDGADDLVMASRSSSSFISVLTNRGDGTFEAAGTYTLDDHPSIVAAYDFNVDGRSDLAVGYARHGSWVPSLTILLGNGDGTLGSLPARYPAGGIQPRASVASDLNRDGVTDLAVVDNTGRVLSVLFNNADELVYRSDQYQLVDHAAALAVGDFNEDNIPDLLLGYWAYEPNTPTYVIYLGKGDGSFDLPPLEFHLEIGFDTILVQDLNNDSFDDLILGYFPDANVILGNGDGTFGPPTEYLMIADQSGRNVWGLGDFDSDGNVDIVVAAEFHEFGFNIRYGLGGGAFGELMEYELGSYGDIESVAVSDFDQNGTEDLALWRYSHRDLLIVLGNGDGTFGPPIQAYLVYPGHFWSITEGDFDSDGLPDLVAVSNLGAFRGITVLLNNGDGTFRNAAEYRYSEDHYGGRDLVGDFNGDNFPDVAVAGDEVAFFINVYGQQPEPAFVSFSDPVGDSAAPIDLTQLDLTFDSASGDYEITFTADPAAPFLGEFRLHANLFNADVGTTAPDPSFLKDDFNNFNFPDPTTTVTLTGTSPNLLSWQAGDRISVRGPDPLGSPDGFDQFWTNLVVYPPTGYAQSDDMPESCAILRTESIGPEAPAIEQTPTNINFGDVLLGTSTSSIVTLQNVGGSDLTLDQIALSENWDAGFYITAAPTLPVVLPPLGSVDVEVTFLPIGEILRKGRLKALSDDPRQCAVYTTMAGTGVGVEDPPSQQVGTIIDRIDLGIGDGSLEPNGPGSSGSGRAGALVNMFEAVDDLVAEGLIEEACEQFTDAANRMDGEPRPPDFIAEGTDPLELAEIRVLVQQLADSIGCDGS